MVSPHLRVEANAGYGDISDDNARIAADAGLWYVWKWPRRIPYPITVSFGPPMPPRATAADVRQAVQELLASAWVYRRRHMQPLHRAFVRSARRHPFRFALADSQSPEASFAAALMKVIFLARRFKNVWAGQKMVGLLLPPSLPGRW
jgi:acyl-[acyl-carrier-protein]-phospholipid O-acyltransferase/long-chain-fatty-acid--[acyl-carrier-protein] ligase